MNTIIRWGTAAVAALGFATSATPAEAQIQVSVGFGSRPAPVVVRPIAPPVVCKPTYYFGVSGRAVHDGYLLTSVDRGSPAAKAGLECGDVIHEVNGRPVHCEYDLKTVIKNSDGCIDLVVHDSRCHRDVNMHVQLAVVGGGHGPVYGGPVYGGPVYGRPDYGRPDYGRPDYGRPDYGRPDYGYGDRPSYGRPGYVGRPSYDAPSDYRRRDRDDDHEYEEARRGPSIPSGYYRRPNGGREL